MLGDRDLYLFKNFVNNSPIPQQLLLIQVIDEEGAMLVYVSPSH